MKIILILLTLVSTVSMANEREIFRGQLENSNKECKLILQNQNPNVNMYTLNFESEDLNLSFYNKILNDGEIGKKYSALYTYSNGRYIPVIGIPIFALGRYYDTEMSIHPNSVEIKIKTMLAGVFDWIQIWSRTYKCF